MSSPIVPTKKTIDGIPSTIKLTIRPQANPNIKSMLDNVAAYQ